MRACNVLLVWVLLLFDAVYSGEEGDCPHGRYITGWKKHDYLSWRSSFGCALTMAERFNRTFVLPETFWYYGEESSLDDAINVRRVASFGQRSRVIRNEVFKYIQGNNTDAYGNHKILPTKPGMGHCEQMENVLASSSCVARNTAHNVYLYCEQEGFGECFPMDEALKYVAAAPMTEKAVNDQLRRLGRYIFMSYSPDLPFDSAMDAIEGLESNLTDYNAMVIQDSSGSDDLLNAVLQFVEDVSGLKNFDVFSMDDLLQPVTCEKVRKGQGCRLFEQQRNQLVILGAAFKLSGDTIKKLDQDKEFDNIDFLWKKHLKAGGGQSRVMVPTMYNTSNEANVWIEEPSRHGPWAWAYRNPSRSDVSSATPAKKSTILTILFFARDIHTVETHCRAGKKMSHYERFNQRNIVDDDNQHTYAAVRIECHFKGVIPPDQKYVTVTYGIGLYMGKALKTKFLRAKIWSRPSPSNITVSQMQNKNLVPVQGAKMNNVSSALNISRNSERRPPQLTACLPTLFCPMNMENFDSNYTLEWLRYHGVNVGVEHVWVYSDDRQCALAFMKALREAGSLPTKVTVIAMYNHNVYANETHYHAQTMAMQDCWLRNRAMQVPWTLYLDWDELLQWPERWKGFSFRDKFEGFTSVTIPSWVTEHRTCLPPHGEDLQAEAGVGGVEQKKSEFSDLVTQGYENGWPRLGRLQLSKHECTACFQRAKLCNHPGHSYCCTGFCGHRKYAIVPARGSPASIHMPAKTGVSNIDLDTRTGLYLRHLKMPVLDQRATSSMCMYVASNSDIRNGGGAGFETVPARADLSAPTIASGGEERYYGTKGGAGGPLNKHGRCVYVV